MLKLTAVQERMLREASKISLLGDGLRIVGSGAHRVARNLESLKYVRLVVPGNGRKAHVHVTPEGRIALRRISKRGEAAVPIPVEESEGSGCSRCGGTGVDPEVSGCRCDCCGGTGIEA
jgi:hypothetical protein